MSDRYRKPWQAVRLGDHTTVKARLGWKGLKAEEYLDDGFIFLATPNLKGNQIDFHNVNYVSKWRYEESPEIQLRNGDVLIVKDGSTLGICSFVRSLPCPATVNGSIAVVRSRQTLHPEYLYHFVTGDDFQELIKTKKAGLGVPHLFQADLREFPISLPSLREQRKIASILTTVDGLIERTETLIEKYRRVKQGMMADLLSRGVDASGKLRPTQQQAPELYKQSELGWIPREWEVKRVEQLGDTKLGRQRSPRHQSGKFTTPYLRVANVFNGWIDYSDVLEMDFTPTERKSYSVLPGDIFLNEGQSIELVGRSATYRGEAGAYCFQNTLVRFRSGPEADPAFCQAVFTYWLEIGRFMTVARRTTSVAHLGADRFAAMLLACPPRDEQSRISRVVNTIREKIQTEGRQQAKLRTLKTGLMQDLLTGKVRVKVDDVEEVLANA